MKVLFVSSGNNELGISPIIKAQGESLIQQGIEVEFFTIKSKGFFGYLKYIPKVRKYLKKNRFDVIHAHYSLSGFVASLAGARPLIVSLMGSDLKAKGYYKFLISFFYLSFWKCCIVKSEDMRKSLGISRVEVIPNGVDLDKFNFIEKDKAKELLSWDKSKKHILFGSNPKRVEKNYQLFKKAFDYAKLNSIAEIHDLVNISHDEISLYMNAADVVSLSSIYEGSPNVIKEAMACNSPIVTTDVGDVSWVIGNTEGCYISTFDPTIYASKLEMAIEFSEKKGIISGRKRIVDLGLDADTIAKRLIEIYDSIIN